MVPFLTLLKTFFAIFSSARGFANGTRAPSSLTGGDGFFSSLISSIDLSPSASAVGAGVWGLDVISWSRRSAFSGVTELLPLLFLELLDLDLLMPSDECLEWDLSFFLSWYCCCWTCPWMRRLISLSPLCDGGVGYYPADGC